MKALMCWMVSGLAPTGWATIEARHAPISDTQGAANLGPSRSAVENIAVRFSATAAVSE